MRKELITAELLDQLPLSTIQKVTFYKRDEITTDRICCDVDADRGRWFFHEEADGWEFLIDYLEQLPGFRSDWYAGVVQPAFAASEFVAYEAP